MNGRTAPRAPSGAHALQRAQMGSVHRDDQVEAREVLRAHLARPQRLQVVAARGGNGAGARIGWVAYVPVADAGGFGFDPSGEAFTLHQHAEYGLCGG